MFWLIKEGVKIQVLSLLMDVSKGQNHNKMLQNFSVVYAVYEIYEFEDDV